MFANTKGVDYSVSDQVITVEDMKSRTMADFSDSFNFVIGKKTSMDPSLKDFDILDNPYIEVNVYEFDQNWQPKYAENM